MPMRLSAHPVNGEIHLVLPNGRHLESPSWWVAAQVLKDLLILRVWVERSRSFRVIVLDRLGSEHGTVLSSTYENATIALGVTGETNNTAVEGRRLVSGGDRDWEIAAETHVIDDERLIYVRVWVHKRQRFVVYAINLDGVIQDRASGDYQQAKQRLLSHLTA